MKGCVGNFHMMLQMIIKVRFGFLHCMLCGVECAPRNANVDGYVWFSIHLELE